MEPQPRRTLVDRIMNYQNKDYLSYALMATANFTWVTGWIYPNQHNFSPMSSNLVRGLSTIILVYIISYFYPIDLDFKIRGNLRWLFLRSMIMTFQGLAVAISQFYLPLPLVHIIISSGNLSVLVLNYLLNGIKINFQQFKGLMVGFFGVLLIINGKLLMHWIDPSYKSQTKYQNYQSDNPYVITLAAFLLLIVMVVWAYGIIITKNLKGINAIQINFHLGIFLIINSTILYPFGQDNITVEQFATCFFLFGFPVIIGQFCFITALLLSKNVGIVTMIMFSGVVWAYLVSIFRYDESQNVICSAGVLLVVWGVWKTLFSKSE